MDTIEKLTNQIEEDGKLNVNKICLERIFDLVKQTNELEGDVAEVGVYKGGTAKIICEATTKPVHLFDTFKGLPAPSMVDDDDMYEGKYHARLKDVREYVNSANAFFYEGMFPESGKAVADKKFSFVHLDVDLCASTLNALKFFYPRMVKGGVILTHDYPTLIGVQFAWDRFFGDKPEESTQLTGAQCYIIKQ